MNKMFIGIIIILFINTSFVSSGYSEEINQIDTEIADVCGPEENVLVTCRTFGFPGEPSQEITMSLYEAEFLLDKIKELQIENARDPLSDKTQQLQYDIIALADEHNLLPAGLSPETLKSRLIQSSRLQHPRITLPRLQNRASELFCNYVSTGSGSSFPIIILPRLIPILLTPIPRLFVRWSTMDGITSCGGLRSGTGFIAYGAQNGIALGFWGIGFSIFLPPVMAYGLLGYALFASVNAQEIELWPPNYPPEISAVSPLDGAQNAPISTSELRFQISDLNGDLMSYSVTTTPNIGSGSGNNKPDGTYTVPISGLEGSEEYTWHVQVSDGENLVDSTFTFTTELVAPVVSNPSPKDGARNVPMPLTQLSFTLKDFQGDLMDYSVETSPNIGSDSATGVSDGTYTIDVSGVDYSIQYTWYVNVTDGTYWKKEEFSFKTRPLPSPWWNDDWPYRKEIIVNYAKVDGNFDNFPVLIKLESDANLASKAQSDGDDIVFTDYSELKLNHEIEFYNDEDGELIAWVNVQSLTPDSILYMYYGNSTCNNQQNVEGTWDSNYMMVQHMQESNWQSTDDSTSKNNDATGEAGNPTYQQSSKIGYGVEFDGDDYITFGSDSSLKPSTMSIEAWINTDSAPLGHTAFSMPYDDGGIWDDPWVAYAIHRDGEYTMAGVINEDGILRYAQWVHAVNVGIWYHAVSTYDGNNLKLYANGVERDSETYPGSITYSGSPVLVAGAHSSHASGEYWDGKLDELRVSNVARSSAWISTEYNNQNDPSSFKSFGPEETGP